MILDVEFEELNSEFQADFGEVHIITDADFIATNIKLDERIHGEDTGTELAENVDEVVAILDDVEAAIEEKGITASGAADYADIIRSELTAGADINPEWTNWSYMYSSNRLDFLNKLKYSDTSHGVDFSFMYNGSSELEIAPPIDMKNCENCRCIYQNCSNLQYIPKMNTGKSKDFMQMCLNCKQLKMIESIDISNATGVNATSAMFLYCNALESITFEGEIPISISFAQSPLSMESIKSIVTHLKDYSGTNNEFANTVTFKAGLWNEFNATECTEGYATWADYVAAKGWNVK